MSRAILCDACGMPVSPLEAITLLVEMPGKGDRNHTSWGSDGDQIGICRACFNRPFGEVLNLACKEFLEEDVKRHAPPEDADGEEPVLSSPHADHD